MKTYFGNAIANLIGQEAAVAMACWIDKYLKLRPELGSNPYTALCYVESRGAGYQIQISLYRHSEILGTLSWKTGCADKMTCWHFGRLLCAVLNGKMDWSAVPELKTLEYRTQHTWDGVRIGRRPQPLLMRARVDGLEIQSGQDGLALTDRTVWGIYPIEGEQVHQLANEWVAHLDAMGVQHDLRGLGVTYHQLETARTWAAAA